MILGILSDSHGDAAATARAVRLLMDHGAEKLIHCGDICSDSVLAELAGHDAIFVWGNCDSPTAALKKYVKTLGLPWPDGSAAIEIDDKKIGVFHGHEDAFSDAVESGQYDYIFHGHTHRFADSRVKKKTRIINPGALYRATVKTVAVLDTATDGLKHFRIDTGERIVVKTVE